jgi:hypothetical protein|nr:MAG TPA: hypothetical protein [Caudoviricetes sp.]
MNLEANQGFKLIAKAIENDRKDRMYQQWLHDSARFEINFNDYVKASKPYRKSTQEEKEEILKKYGGR